MTVKELKEHLASLPAEVDDSHVIMYNSAWQEWFITDDVNKPRVGGPIKIEGRMYDVVVAL